MKKEHIMDAMDYIDPALVAAADAPGPRRGRKGRVRYGLIAACLCLALIGTAAAVNHLGVRAETDEDGIVWFRGGIAQYPYAIFSDELKALEGEPSAKAFKSWQEMEDFIGLDLVNNPLLDAHPAHYSFVWSESVKGRCILSISAGQDRMFLHGMFSIDGYDISLEGFLHTDHIPDGLKDFYENEWNQGTIGVMYQPDGSTKEITQEVYTTPGGLDVQIVTQMQKDGFCILHAGCSIKGVAYIIKIPCHNKEGASGTTLDGAQTVLIQVLDSFILN